MGMHNYHSATEKQRELFARTSAVLSDDRLAQNADDPAYHEKRLRGWVLAQLGSSPSPRKDSNEHRD